MYIAFKTGLYQTLLFSKAKVSYFNMSLIEQGASNQNNGNNNQYMGPDELAVKQTIKDRETDLKSEKRREKFYLEAGADKICI